MWQRRMVLGQDEYCGLVILARLGASVQVQGRGVGIGLLKDAIQCALMISDQAGIRALLTHPMDEEAARFYSRFGFERSPLREYQLLLFLKDAQRMLVGDV